MKNNRTLFIAEFSLLAVIEAVFCFTFLGSLPIGPTIVATLAMIPVIITGELLGYKAGAALGFICGIFSVIWWTLMPGVSAPFAFAFTPFYSTGELRGNFFSLVISIVPRTLVGVTSGLLCAFLLKHARKPDIFIYALCAAVGSLTNTIGVLGGIWLFFGKEYASAAGKSIYDIIRILVLTNGVPEAAVAAVVCPAVVKPLVIVTKRH